MDAPLADEERGQLRAVVDVVAAVLRHDLAAAYLYGSAVAGGLRPHSDLDVFAVSRRATTAEERQSLVDGLRPLSRKGQRPAGWRPVELTIVVEWDVRPWRYPPRMDFQYGEWLQEEFARGINEPSPQAHADLAVLVAMVRVNGHAVHGPPPSALLAAVPRGDVARAMVEGVDALHADLESDTTNVLLTLARIWRTLAEGTFASKDAAAEWALQRMPPEHAAVLQRARATYLGATGRWDDLQPQVPRAAAELIRQIQRQAPADAP